MAKSKTAPAPPPALERRTLAAEFCETRVEKREDDDDARTISGYAARFYDGTPATEYELWDNAVERILPGAFDRAVKEDDVRGLFNHDPDNLLGRTAAGTMRLTVDDKGLRYAIDAPDTATGRDVVTSIDRGDLTGSSFSFRVTSAKWTDEAEDDGGREIREILEVELFDVGPVTYPAYESTTAAVRSDGARAERDAWRGQDRSARIATTARARQRLARAIQVETEAAYT